MENIYLYSKQFRYEVVPLNHFPIMPHKEIRSVGVPDTVFTELKLIAKNSGVTLTELLKPHLPKIVESYPERLRKARF
jgi:hypothetical protein